MWLQNVQRSSFQEEIQYMNQTSNCKKPSIIRQLGLYLGRDTMRCGGRIDNSTVSEDATHPYLLPTKHCFTTLIVKDAHDRQLHGGVNSTITQLRQIYWIPRIQQCVKNILRTCVIYQKVTGRPYSKPDLPPLPEVRLHDNAQMFKVTGVDFAGPLYVKNPYR